MEGIAGVVWLIVIVIVVTAANVKKEKKAQEARQRAMQRTGTVPPARPQANAETPKAPERSAFTEGHDPCHEDMLSGTPARPHRREERGSEFMESFTDVSTEEGIDPCHDELYERPEASEKQEGAQDTGMNPIVQGIVWSAILQRPNARARR